MATRGGWVLFAFILFSFTLYDRGRFLLHLSEDSAPVVFRTAGARVLVVFGDGNLNGIHQINDGTDLLGVIKMASYEVAPGFAGKLGSLQRFFDGEKLELQIVSGSVVALRAGWMSAAKRMSLGIPLDVEQMSLADWDDLPGVGPSLALKISTYRQKNGGIHHFSELKKINGVGLKRLERWAPFFYISKLLNNKHKKIKLTKQQK